MITLVLGGTRSGKSAFAESLASRHPSVTYVATAMVGDDPDFRARVAAHAARRPEEWTTTECPDPADLAATLERIEGCVLLDSVGTWVAGHRNLDLVDPGPLVAALRSRRARTIVVSEEVGLSIHPTTGVGRAFVDALGATNAAISEVAADAYLVVAGRPLTLPSAGGPSC